MIQLARLFGNYRHVLFVTVSTNIAGLYAKAYVEANGVRYFTAETEPAVGTSVRFAVNAGDIIKLWVSGDGDKDDPSYGEVIINKSIVYRHVDEKPSAYEWTVPDDISAASITISGSIGTFPFGRIGVTTA